MFSNIHKVSVNGEQLAYRKVGSGEQVMVLLHGNMSSSQHFDLLANELNTHYTIVMPDMRGFGASSYNNPVESLEDFADDVLALLDTLNVSHYEVFGWSTGGGIAMVMAAKRPEQVKKLYLLESVGTTGYPMQKKDIDGTPIQDVFLRTREEIAEDPVQVVPVLNALEKRDKVFYKSLWDFAIYSAGKQPEPERYEVYLEDMLTQRNLVDVDYALVNFNISHAASPTKSGNGMVSNIKCPVVVFQGSHDLVVPMDMAHEICRDIPQSKLVIVENAGHNPMVDRMDILLAHMVPSHVF